MCHRGRLKASGYCCSGGARRPVESIKKIECHRSERGRIPCRSKDTRQTSGQLICAEPMKSSRAVQAVCAYGLSSSEGFKAEARGHNKNVLNCTGTNRVNTISCPVPCHLSHMGTRRYTSITFLGTVSAAHSRRPACEPCESLPASIRRCAQYNLSQADHRSQRRLSCHSTIARQEEARGTVTVNAAFRLECSSEGEFSRMKSALAAVGIHWSGSGLDNAILFPAAMMSQTFLGSIVGTMTDTSGPSVPAAKVRLTNTGTNDERTTSTSNSGDYQFLNLVPGTYRISVEKQGFSEWFGRTSRCRFRRRFASTARSPLV